MFRLALSNHIYSFAFRDTNLDTLSPCAPKHVMWQRVFRDASEFEVRNLIQCTGHFAIYVRWLLGWRYISSLHSADEPQEGRNSCPLLWSYFIGSCHVGVSKRFSRSISLAVYCLSSYFLVRFGGISGSFGLAMGILRSMARPNALDLSPKPAKKARLGTRLKRSDEVV